MTNSPNEPAGQDWDQLLEQLRQLRQQVQKHGPLDDEQKVEATNAFNQGFLYLDSQVNDIRNGGLKGSSGKW